MFCTYNTFHEKHYGLMGVEGKRGLTLGVMTVLSVIQFYCIIRSDVFGILCAGKFSL